MRTAAGLILASILVLAQASCTRHFVLTSPTQLAQLPVSRGINGGSYVALTSWQYRGSHYGLHHFYYYYHADNLLHRREVSIPRRTAVLHFREAVSGSDPQWVTLQPDSTVFHFFPFRSRRP